MYYGLNGERIGYHKWSELVMAGVPEITKYVNGVTVTTRWTGFDLGISSGPALCWETVTREDGSTEEKIAGRWPGEVSAKAGHRQVVGIERRRETRKVSEKIRTGYSPP